MKVEFPEEVSGDKFGERFNEEETALLDFGEKEFHHLLVIDRVFDPIAACRLAGVRQDLEIDSDLLPHLSFPSENTDDTVRFQSFNKDKIFF